MNLARLSLTAACIVAFALSPNANAAYVANSPAPLGRPAPAFNLPNVLTGAHTSLASLARGKKAVVVIFISTQCPVSNAYNDRMSALANAYSRRDVAFIGIDSNQTEPFAVVSGYTKEHNFPFPVVKDTDSMVANSYGARCTPETYVIDSRGVLDYHGRIDNNMDLSLVETHDLADALNSVLAGKAVVHPLTKAFGCSIKRS